MSFPHRVVPVFGSQRAYADLNFAGGSFGLNGRIVNDTALLPGFTFTGASLRTMFDSTGAMTYGPNNLCLQSQTFDNAAWTKQQATISADATTAPDGTLTADKLVEDTSTATHRLFNATAVTVSTTNVTVYSVYVKAAGRNFAFVSDNDSAGAYFNLTTGVASNISAGVSAASVDAGNGWWRCYIAVISASGNGRLAAGAAIAAGTSSYLGDGTSGIYLWGAQLEAVTYRTTPAAYMPTTSAAYYGPRLAYDPVTLASLGILVEEARTNVCLQSQEFDNAAWTKSGSTITADAIAAPDGTLTADKLVEDSGTSQHRTFNNAAVTVSTTNATVYSVYVKAAGRNFAFISDNAAQGAYFNLTTGAASNLSAGVTASSVDAGNGWWRCYIAVTAITSSGRMVAGAATAAGTNSYTGDGTSGIYLWGAQLEAGPGASSYIPTTTAAVTRAADVPIETTALTYPLTIVAEFIRNWDAGAAQIVCQVDAGSDTDRAYASIDSSDLFAGTTSGSGASTVAGATVAGTAYKGAVRVATNDVQTARGGTLGTGDTSATNPASPTRIVIGGANAAGNPWNGTISRIRVYNRALSDAQLQALTA